MKTTQNSVWNLITQLASKKDISEIVINDPTHIFVERGGNFSQLNARVRKDHIFEFINAVSVSFKASYNSG